MENNKLIKYNGAILKSVDLAVDITKKVIAAFEPGLIPFRRYNKWGFCNHQKEIVIDCKYDFVNQFHDSLAIVEQGDNYSFINSKGNKPFAHDYGYLSSFKHGYSVVTNYNGPKIAMNGSSGLIDQVGKEILPPRYSQIVNSGFNYGLNVIQTKTHKWGYVTSGGEEIYLNDYGEVSTFYDGIAQVSTPFNPNIYITPAFIKYGFIDRNFNRIIDLKYDNAWDFSDNLAAVELNGKWGFIDKYGENIIPFQFNNSFPFSEGLAGVRLNNQWGFIDKIGRVSIPFNYSQVYPFNEGIAQICINDKWGYINTKGELAISCIYGGTSNFVNGLAKVYYNGQYGFIDKKGTQYWQDY